MDPYFYEEDLFDKDSFEDASSEFCDDDIFESDSEFDRSVEMEIEKTLSTGQLNADQMAIALGFGEHITAKEESYDIDEDTDKENLKEVIKLGSLKEHEHHNTRSLSVFEQYINKITSGQCKGPWAQG